MNHTLGITKLRQFISVLAHVLQKLSSTEKFESQRVSERQYLTCLSPAASQGADEQGTGIRSKPGTRAQAFQHVMQASHMAS